METSEKYGKCSPLKMNFLYQNHEFERLNEASKALAWEELKRRVDYLVLQVIYDNIKCHTKW